MRKCIFLHIIRFKSNVQIYKKSTCYYLETPIYCDLLPELFLPIQFELFSFEFKDGNLPWEILLRILLSFVSIFGRVLDLLLGILFLWIHKWFFLIIDKRVRVWLYFRDNFTMINFKIRKICVTCAIILYILDAFCWEICSTEVRKNANTSKMFLLNVKWTRNFFFENNIKIIFFNLLS